MPFHGDGDLQEVQYQLEGELWFKWETERLREHLPKDGVVIDVGANLGFTRYVVPRSMSGRQADLRFRTVSPGLYEASGGAGKNQLRYVQCFNLGCGSARSEETLLVPASSGNATIRRSGVHLAKACREINIEIDTLDNVILPLARKIDFLKIDTEGFEDQVLAGSR